MRYRGTGRWGWCVLVAFLGCDDARKPAEELVFAVRELRDARQADKPAKLEGLRDLDCKGEALCSYRSQCLVAYEKHLDATSRVAQLKSAPSNPENLEVVKALRRDLEQVERQLLEARTLADDCLRREGELVERYKL